ncbi:hypothetical protein [Paenibacillus sp. 453mf]|nr:hypothetical protein [Paenibacillus sp. 453mf]
MKNEGRYKFAELNDQSEAVELIQRTEQQLTKAVRNAYHPYYL